MTELKLDPHELAILLIDVQPFFVGQMVEPQEPILIRLEQLLIMSNWFQLPVLATCEEPVHRKGELVERLQAKFPSHGQVYRKQMYDLCGEPDILQALKTLGRQQLIVTGTETDVCVLQSVLGLLDHGYQVFILEDCLFSSSSATEVAIYRMRQAGAIPLTYKSLHYELLKTENSEQWQAGHKAAIASGLLNVESLPPTDDA
jgi:nicotinamidase-related amidase